MSDSKAYAGAMSALQRKVQYLEDENRALHSQLKSCQFEIQKLVDEIQNKECLFETLENKLQQTISSLEEDLLKKDDDILRRDAQIESLSQELHLSLSEQSKIMDQQLQDRELISDQQTQIQKLKSVINKLKDPKPEDTRFTQSEKKTPFVSRLDNAVESYFKNENNGYELLIRRISKLEKEIAEMEDAQSNKLVLDQKLLLLRELQEQEESLLQLI